MARAEWGSSAKRLFSQIFHANNPLWITQWHNGVFAQTNDVLPVWGSGFRRPGRHAPTTQGPGRPSGNAVPHNFEVAPGVLGEKNVAPQFSQRLSRNLQRTVVEKHEEILQILDLESLPGGKLLRIRELQRCPFCQVYGAERCGTWSSGDMVAQTSSRTICGSDWKYKGPGQSLRKKEPGFVDDMVVVYVLFVLTSFRRMFVQYRASIWKSNPWSGGTLGELLELWPAALLFVPLLANSSSPCFPLFQIRDIFFW